MSVELKRSEAIHADPTHCTDYVLLYPPPSLPNASRRLGLGDLSHSTGRQCELPYGTGVYMSFEAQVSSTSGGGNKRGTLGSSNGLTKECQPRESNPEFQQTYDDCFPFSEGKLRWPSGKNLTINIPAVSPKFCSCGPKNQHMGRATN